GAAREHPLVGVEVHGAEVEAELLLAVPYAAADDGRGAERSGRPRLPQAEAARLFEFQPLADELLECGRDVEVVADDRGEAFCVSRLVREAAGEEELGRVAYGIAPAERVHPGA